MRVEISVSNMFEFWLSFMNPMNGWQQRQAYIDDPLIALYRHDPTNFHMLKSYIRDQVCKKVTLGVPWCLDIFMMSLEDGVYNESISLSSVDDRTKLEVTIDKAKRSTIRAGDLLWTQREDSLTLNGGWVRIKYDVTEYTQDNARMLVDAILEHFPNISRMMEVRRKTALAMALHPRLGANSTIACISSELMAMVNKAHDND